MFLSAVLIAVGFSIVAPVAPPAQAAVPCMAALPEDTTAYAETRQFVENQSWWMPGPGQADNSATNHGHAHMGACIPERETITSGNLTLNVRVIMHDNPGKWNYVSMVFKGTDYETTVQKCYLRQTMTNFTCPTANSSTSKGDWTCVGTCTRWVRFTAPISSFNHAGLQEVRLRGFVPEPGSKEMRTNLNFQVYIQNGKSTANVTREPQLRSKGWYTHSLYCEASVNSVPIPNGPVSGTWSPVLEQTTHTSDGSLPVTHSFVSLDPDFHAVPPVQGTIIHSANGGYGPVATSINTTTLTNGVHKLYQRADCRDDSLGSTNSGVLVIPFNVSN